MPTTPGQRLRDLEISQGVYDPADPDGPANVLLTAEVAENIARFQRETDGVMSNLNAAASAVRTAHAAGSAAVQASIKEEADALVSALEAVKTMVASRTMTASAAPKGQSNSSVEVAAQLVDRLHRITADSVEARGSVQQAVDAGGVPGLPTYTQALLDRIDARQAVWLPVIDTMQARLDMSVADPGSWTW